VLTRTIALAKAKSRARETFGNVPAAVITADSVVVFKGQTLEKPNDVEEARAFLRSYSDHAVRSLTSVVVTTTGFSGTWLYETDRAFVQFDAINHAAIENAIARGDVLQSSGGSSRATRTSHPTSAPSTARSTPSSACARERRADARQIVSRSSKRGAFFVGSFASNDVFSPQCSVHFFWIPACAGMTKKKKPPHVRAVV